MILVGGVFYYDADREGCLVLSGGGNGVTWRQRLDDRRELRINTV